MLLSELLSPSELDFAELEREPGPCKVLGVISLFLRRVEIFFCRLYLRLSYSLASFTGSNACFVKVLALTS